MADAQQTETTPADTDLAHVQPDGTVDTQGREAFVWCQDDSTGHRFDLHVRTLPRSGVTVVEGYRLNFKKGARRAKTRLQWSTDSGEPGGEETTQDADVDGDGAGDAEVPDGPSSPRKTTARKTR